MKIFSSEYKNRAWNNIRSIPKELKYRCLNGSVYERASSILLLISLVWALLLVVFSFLIPPVLGVYLCIFGLYLVVASAFLSSFWQGVFFLLFIGFYVSLGLRGLL